MGRLKLVSLALVVALATLASAIPSEAGRAGPSISSISPGSTVAGSPGFTLAVVGSNFSPNSVVLCNGQPRTTTFISKIRLAAFIPSSDVAQAGSPLVAVANPKPAYQLSNSLPLIVTSPALQITTTELPTGQVAVPYAASVTAAGGAAPYTWSVASGSLPPGLVLASSTGTVSGTPSQSGKSSFTLQVKDSSQSAVAQPYAVSVAPAPSPLVISTSLLPNGTVGVAYDATLAATGGTPPYSWSVISGALPPGLLLDAATGAIKGTPTTSGPYAFTVQVKDAAALPQSASQAFTISIAAASLQITTSSLPSGQVQVSYQTTLAATGGTPPYSWSVVSG